MPRILASTERNDLPFTDLSGTVNSGGGFLVRGIARAGSSFVNAGSWFQGTYGALLLNADGSYTYRLDHRDADTEVLGAGQIADDRFTYTYTQNGITRTDTIIVHVSGIDEPGQQIVVSSGTAYFITDHIVDALMQYRMSSIVGSVARAENTEHNFVVNRGMIRSEAPANNGATAIAVGRNGQYSAMEFVNDGLVEAHAGTGAYQTIAVNAYGGANIVNHGVIRAISEGVNQANYAQATGSGGWHLVNTGVIEAISSQEAWAVNVGNRLDNYGLIYAEGTTRMGIPGIVGVYEPQSAGITINNDGTIWAVSRTAGIDSFGISFFRDSTDPYAYASVNNSGTIVADVAVLGYATAVGGITGIHVVNSGHVEGDWDMDFGLNLLDNRAGANWIGDLRGGANEDVVRNRGLVYGAVTLGAEDDLFDGRGGVQSGPVDGGAGIDVLFGGAEADQLSGGAGSDRLIGGGGADNLAGGADGDLFVYRSLGDSTAAAFDTIADFQTGSDRVDVSALAPLQIALAAAGGGTRVTVTTAAGALVLQVNGTIALSDFVVTPAGAVVAGTAAAESLLAAMPSSELHGDAGDDVLDGSDGADLLDGGAGADLMRGGAGNDVYVLDNGGDRLFEFDGEGIDEVRTLVSCTLQAYVENAVLIGSGPGGVNGNRLNNVITGNESNSVLSGREGNDILIGGGGLDELNGGDGADLFVYRAVGDSTGAGRDSIRLFETGIDRIDLSAIQMISIAVATTVGDPWAGSPINNNVTVQAVDGTMTILVERMLEMGDFILPRLLVAGTPNGDVLPGSALGDRIEGGAGNDVLDGRGGGDRIEGGSGDDRIAGGPGADLIDGGSGGDTFLFTTLDDSRLAALRSDGKKILPDALFGFTSGEDKIDLSQLDANPGTAGDDAFVFIGGGAFGGHAGELRCEARGVQTLIFGDVDGDGYADFQILVDAPALAAGDFVF